MKKLLLVITLINAVAFGAEPSTITFVFNDGARETFSLFSPEMTALKQSPFFNNLLDDTGNDTTAVPLEMERNTFATIIDMVSTRIRGELPLALNQISEEAQQKMRDKLARLNISELINVILASDYLGIDHLFDLAVQSFKQSGHLKELIDNPQALETVALLHRLPAHKLEGISSSLLDLLMRRLTASLQIFSVIHIYKINAAINRDGSLIALAKGINLSPDKTEVSLVQSKPVHKPGEKPLPLLSSVLNTVPTQFVGPLTFSSDDAYLAYVWHEPITTIDSSNVHSTSYHPVVDIIHMKTKKSVGSFRLPEDKSITSITFSSDNSRLFVSSSTTIYSYDLASGDLIQKQIAHYPSHVYGMNNSRTQFVVSTNVGYELYDSFTLQLIHRFTYQGKRPSAEQAFSYDDTLFIYTTLLGDILVWNTQTGELVHALSLSQTTFSSGQTHFSQVLISNDSSQLVVSAIQRDGPKAVFKIGVWDLQTGFKKGEHSVPSNKTHELRHFWDISTDGQFLVGADDKGLIFYQLPTFSKFQHPFAMNNRYNGEFRVKRAQYTNQFILEWNIDSVLTFSLEPLVAATKNVAQLNLTQKILLIALLTSDSNRIDNAQMIESIKTQMATVDPTLKELVYKQFSQLRPKPLILSRAIK